MSNTRLAGVFKTTILSIVPEAPKGREPTYEVAVIVNGVSHTVRVGIMDHLPGEGYSSAGGFREVFPYARDALWVIGSWTNRVHKGEKVQFPVHLVI
jgi:hypothetical protein